MKKQRMTLRLCAFLCGVAALVTVVFQSHAIFAATESETLREIFENKEKNAAESANLSCEQYVYPLPCGETDSSGRKGGHNCPCSAEVVGGNTVSGHCIWGKDPNNPELPPKGICEANIVVADTPKTPEYSQPDTGYSGTDEAASDSPQPTSYSSTPSQTASQPSVGQSSASQGVSNSFNTQSSASPSASQPSAPSGSSGYSPSYNSGYSSGYGSSVSGLTGGTGYYNTLSPTTYYPAPSGLSGGNWSYLGPYSYQLPAQPVPSPSGGVVYYYYPYGTPPPQGQAPGGTFIQPSGPTGPIQNYNNFLDILAYAGTSAIDRVKKIYDSLVGVSQPPSYITQGSVPRTPGSQTSVQLIPDSSASGATNAANPETTSEVQFYEAVQQVQFSMRELGKTIAARQGIGTEVSSTTVPAADITVPQGTSSPPSMQAQTPPRDALSERAVEALEMAEERVTQLQEELEEGKAQLRYSDAKVRELTDELNALNERIQAVNEALSDPSISESDRSNLIDALITNIQLTLENVEKRLREESAQGETRTVGEVVIQALQNGLSGFIEWTTQVSRAFAELIQAFWRNLFSVGA